MPILSRDRELKNCPDKIPMSLLSESTAYRNHGQTLHKLAERGGLSVKEALCIISNKDWEYYANMPTPLAVAQLNEILEQQQ